MTDDDDIEHLADYRDRPGPSPEPVEELWDAADELFEAADRFMEAARRFWGEEMVVAAPEGGETLRVDLDNMQRRIRAFARRVAVMLLTIAEEEIDE
ncbi:MAG: hypothetical protein ABEH81_16255 [Halopenitus sp.]